MSNDHVRDHLANERTFLAWIRTAIGLIVFGFAVGRFGLALQQLAAASGAHVRTFGVSLWFGTALIGFGVVLMLGAYLRYQQVRKQLDMDTFEPTGGLLKVVTLIAGLFGIGLVVYLLITQRILR